MKIRFLTLAQEDLDNAVAWYDRQSEGAGQDFLDELDRTVRRTIQFPLSNPEIEPGVRRRLMARFPYALIYGIDGDACSRCRGTFTSSTTLLDRLDLS